LKKVQWKTNNLKGIYYHRQSTSHNSHTGRWQTAGDWLLRVSWTLTSTNWS